MCLLYSVGFISMRVYSENGRDLKLWFVLARCPPKSMLVLMYYYIFQNVPITKTKIAKNLRKGKQSYIKSNFTI